MQSFLIRIDIEHRDTLKQYGKILFSTKLLGGIVCLMSDLSISEISILPHVIKADIDRTGRITV